MDSWCLREVRGDAGVEGVDMEFDGSWECKKGCDIYVYFRRSLISRIRREREESFFEGYTGYWVGWIHSRSCFSSTQGTIL